MVIHPLFHAVVDHARGYQIVLQVPDLQARSQESRTFASFYVTSFPIPDVPVVEPPTTLWSHAFGWSEVAVRFAGDRPPIAPRENAAAVIGSSACCVIQ